MSAFLRRDERTKDRLTNANANLGVIVLSTPMQGSRSENPHFSAGVLEGDHEVVELFRSLQLRIRGNHHDDLKGQNASGSPHRLGG